MNYNGTDIFKNKYMMFGVSGIPPELTRNEYDALFGLLKDNKLRCAEVSFSEGLGQKTENLLNLKKSAIENNIKLSVHSPYFINLNAQEEKKVRLGMLALYESARLSNIAGADSLVFHPGFYMGKSSESAFEKILERTKKVRKDLDDNNINVILRPETMGKKSQFGNVDEILSLCESVEGVLPCLDFSHIHARDGKQNTHDEFYDIFLKVEKSLGSEGLKNMHCHVSGIEYGEHGEIRHTHLLKSDMNFDDLMIIFYEFNAKGRIISESSDPFGDSLLLKDSYESNIIKI
ncbi:MAG: TIM barrel protein [Methanosarcinaceae archaeon]|nr:TIM barrel protein [Methanosarcinaceae archaeon]